MATKSAARPRRALTTATKRASGGAARAQTCEHRQVGHHQPFVRKVHEHSETGFAVHQQLVHNLGRGDSLARLRDDCDDDENDDLRLLRARVPVSTHCFRSRPAEFARTLVVPSHGEVSCSASLGHRCRTPAYESSTAACAR